jgi:hypothetical protein
VEELLHTAAVDQDHLIEAVTNHHHTQNLHTAKADQVATNPPELTKKPT